MSNALYPLVITFNNETKKFNGYLPDLILPAEGDTELGMITELKKLVLDYFHAAIENGAAVPKPSELESLAAKWPKEGGYTLTLLDPFLYYDWLIEDADDVEK